MKNFPLSAESAPEEFREKDKVGGPVRSCPPPPPSTSAALLPPGARCVGPGPGWERGKAAATGGNQTGGRRSGGGGRTEPSTAFPETFLVYPETLGRPETRRPGAAGPRRRGAGQARFAIQFCPGGGTLRTGRCSFRCNPRSFSPNEAAPPSSGVARAGAVHPRGSAPTRDRGPGRAPPRCPQLRENQRGPPGASFNRNLFSKVPGGAALNFTPWQRRGTGLAPPGLSGENR